MCKYYAGSEVACLGPFSQTCSDGFFHEGCIALKSFLWLTEKRCYNRSRRFVKWVRLTAREPKASKTTECPRRSQGRSYSGQGRGSWRLDGREGDRAWMYTDKSSSFPFSVLCITHCAERAQSVLCVCRYPWEWDHVRLSPSRAPHTVPRAQEVLRRHLGDLWITSKEGVDRNKELWRACQHSNK